MKPISFLLTGLIAIGLINVQCKKETDYFKNSPPKVYAGSDIQVILPANSCVLSGSAQDDENNIDVIQWKKISGPASFSLGTPGLVSTTVNDLVLGVYHFELTVTDEGGLSARDTVAVTVNSTINGNHPPGANAGPDQLIHLPTNSVNLDGSSSSDMDNNITSYRWTKIAGPMSYTIANADVVQTMVTGLTVGTYKFELQVEDVGGLSAKDTVDIVVSPVLISNQPPTANAGLDKSITLPLNYIILNGISSTDPDNNIMSYQWTKIAGPSSFIIFTPGDVQTIVNNLVVGTYKFELKVTDSAGLSDIDTVQVIVNPVAIVNQPPVAKAGLDKAILLPVNNTNLDGRGSSDPNNNIVSFQWTKVAGPSAFTIVTPTAAQTVVTNLVEGVYEFELKVTDAGGLWSKDTIKITVYNGPQELIFYDRTWIFPWYNSLEVSNFHSYVPANIPFSIYVRRDTNPVWVEAYPINVNPSPGPYEYFIETRPDGGGMYTFGSLYIFYYGNDVSDSPDVKIVF